MYDPRIVDPMRQELTSAGFHELRTAAEVDEKIGKSTGTLLCVVNSVCGCAAGGARPGVKLSLKHAKVPQTLTTVFAGQDKEATDKARSYFVGYAPSSPAVALFKDGKIVELLERRNIEGHSPAEIASQLTALYDKHC